MQILDPGSQQDVDVTWQFAGGWAQYADLGSRTEDVAAECDKGA